MDDDSQQCRRTHWCYVISLGQVYHSFLKYFSKKDFFTMMIVAPALVTCAKVEDHNGVVCVSSLPDYFYLNKVMVN